MKIPIKKFDHPRPTTLEDGVDPELKRGPFTYDPEFNDLKAYTLALEAHHKEETEWLISEIQRVEEYVSMLEKEARQHKCRDTYGEDDWGYG